LKSLSIYNSDFITIKTGNDALEENIERILLTTPGERVDNPSFGCNLKNNIFNFDSYLIEDIKIDIQQAIQKWEPRATFLNLSVQKTQPYQYTVVVNIINNIDNTTLDITTILNT
jgi:phage baseplate assembly protein W